MKTEFSKIAIGSRFECNGNICIKRSNRTAYLEQFEKVFYFRKNDLVTLLSWYK